MKGQPPSRSAFDLIKNLCRHFSYCVRYWDIEAGAFFNLVYFSCKVFQYEISIADVLVKIISWCWEIRIDEIKFWELCWILLLPKIEQIETIQNIYSSASDDPLPST